MPIFAYQCGACGHQFDALQKLNAEPMSVCPACEAPELRKLLSAPKVHVRGGRRAEAEQPGPKKKPRLMHAFDSPQAHADHHSHGNHDHGGGHKHDHKHTHKHD